MIECKGSNLGLYFCDQMDTAAELAVKLAKEYMDKRDMAEADAKAQKNSKLSEDGSKKVLPSSS